jgi:hypothetical protein
MFGLFNGYQHHGYCISLSSLTLSLSHTPSLGAAVSATEARLTPPPPPPLPPPGCEISSRLASPGSITPSEAASLAGAESELGSSVGQGGGWGRGTSHQYIRKWKVNFNNGQIGSQQFGSCLARSSLVLYRRLLVSLTTVYGAHQVPGPNDYRSYHVPGLTDYVSYQAPGLTDYTDHSSLLVTYCGAHQVPGLTQSRARQIPDLTYSIAHQVPGLTYCTAEHTRFLVSLKAEHVRFLISLTP